MSAAAEAKDYLPIGRCDCILDDDTKETPLHRAVNLASHGSVPLGPLKVVLEALLAKHGDLQAQDSTGATPLHLAAFHGQASATSILAAAALRSSAGRRIFGIQDQENLTPLGKALKVWQVPPARILALSGAPAANATLQLECQPELVEAVLKTDLAASSQLIAAAEVPNTAGHCLVPPNPGRNSSLLHLASALSAEEGALQVIQLLLDAGAQLHHADRNGETALIAALREDSTEVVNVMLAADNSGRLLSRSNRQNQSALHLAVILGASNSVRLLVAKGAATDLKDAEGLTPLDYAKRRNDVEAVQSITAGEALVAAEEASEDGAGAGGFKSSAAWSEADELAAGRQDVEEGLAAPGLSTELVAAVIVAVACGGLCLVLIVYMVRRRLGRRKRSTVAQEAKPEAVRRKEVWMEQTEALPNRTQRRSPEERPSQSNEVHPLPGNSLKSSPAVVVQTAPSSRGGEGPPSPQSGAKHHNSEKQAKKGKVSQGPRQAAKAESPAPAPAQRPARKVKAKPVRC